MKCEISATRKMKATFQKKDLVPEPNKREYNIQPKPTVFSYLI
jgi:hypothetical protein